MNAHRLRTADLAAPLGLSQPRPRFAWWLDASGKDCRQSACQVRLVTGDGGEEVVWDSGQVTTRELSIPCGVPLAPFTRYAWSVRVWDERGHPSDWSEPALFETGAFTISDWPAAWLARDPAYPQLVHARCEIMLPADSGPVLAARLHVASGIADFANQSLRMNYFEAFCNGQRLGEDVMSPGQIAPEGDRALVRTYDVTAMLRPGTANALGLRFISSKISAVLVLHTAGNRHQFVASHAWQMTGGGRFLQLWPDEGRDEQGGKGEVQDARRELTGWAEPGYDACGWTPAPAALPPAVISAQHQPLVALESLPALAITEPRPGVYVVDFGQNSHGFARLRVRGASGDSVTLRYAEHLHPDPRPHAPPERIWGDESFDRSGPDGSIDWISARNHGQKEPDAQHDVFILAGGGEETLAPSFSNHGFRCVEITGLRSAPRPEDICSVVVHSPVLAATRFNCSHPLINRLHDLAAWSMRTNLLSVPTDCPHRERNGWLGDALCVSEGESLLFDLAAFWDKWFTDLGDAQGADGFIPDIVPFGVRPDRFDVPWQSAVVLVAWDHWQAAGDLDFLRRHYPMMKRWLESVAMQAGADGHLEDPCFWGDWVCWADQAATKPYLGNAYFHRSAELLASIATALEERDDALAWTSLADRSRRAIRARYRSADGTWDNGTQSALVHALHFQLCDADERPLLEKFLADDLARQGRITTGCLGTTWLLPALTAAGRDDLAYALVTDPEHNWGWWANHCGATTALETWIGERVSSYNHPFLAGGMLVWLYRRLAGIAPAAPGYAGVVIAPYFAPGLDHCEAAVQTPRGIVRTHWQRNESSIDLELTIPAGMGAELRLPGQPAEHLGSGNHRRCSSVAASR